MKQGQNNRDYLLRRLARDYADILERYRRGEFKSVRAAAIEAGIIKSVSLFDQAQKILCKLSISERRLILLQLEQEFLVENNEFNQTDDRQLLMFQ